MRAMKDSGVEWIGEIPTSWGLKRLKFFANFNPETELPEYSDTDIVSFIPMDHLKAGFHNTAAIEFQKVKNGYVTFQDNDILMAKVTPCLENGNLAIAKDLIDGFGFGSTEINVIRCNDINRQYLFYLLQCPGFIEKATYNMFGVAGLKRLEPRFIPDALFPIPTIEEQQIIVTFLNSKCAEIDALIAAKEKTNALLKAHRQSIIYEAVTKGFDPAARMKDSGVEWIGGVPEGWKIIALKRLGTLATGSTPPKDNPDYWDGDIPWVSSKDMKSDYLLDSEDHITQAAVDKCGLTLFSPETLIFCVRSGILRHTFPVAVATLPVTINQDLRALSLTRDVNPAFLLYYMRGMNDTIVTLYQKIGATVESIEMDWFLYFPVVLPPREEQDRIVEVLDSRCASLDQTVQQNEATVRQLKEYRQSLIYEAVTGKIEV